METKAAIALMLTTIHDSVEGEASGASSKGLSLNRGFALTDLFIV